VGQTKKGFLRDLNRPGFGSDIVLADGTPPRQYQKTPGTVFGEYEIGRQAAHRGKK